MSALLFSIGLGVAVASTGGMATATAATGEGAETTVSTGDSPAEKAEPSSPAQDGAESQADEDNAEDTADDTAEEGPDEEDLPDEIDLPEGQEPDSDVVLEPTDDDIESTDGDTPVLEGNEQPAAQPPAEQPRDGIEQRSAEVNDVAPVAAPLVDDDDISPPTTELTPTTEAADPPPSAETVVPQTAPETSAPSAAGQSVAATFVAPSAPTARGVVSRLLAMVGLALPPSLSYGPIAPTWPSVLIGALEAVRREIDRFFFNDAPVVDPRQIVAAPESGVVIGTLNVVDAENDRLRYIVVKQPTYGQVTIHPDGTYIYRPHDDVPGTVRFEGYDDAFTVRVVDRGITMRSILDRLTGAEPGSAMRVAVEVPPQPGFGGGPIVTVRFHVVNASSKPVTLEKYREHGIGQVTLAPPVAAVLQPGETHHFEVVYYFLGFGQANPTYVSANGLKWDIHLGVDGVANPKTSCAPDGGAQCTPPQWTDWNQEVVLLDVAGTTVDIPSGQGQAQAEVLNRLCAGGRIATCSFVSKKQASTYAKDRLIWDYTTQESAAKLSETIESVNSSSQSVEVGASAGLNIKKIVSVELSTKYSQEWTESLKVSRKIEMTVPPWTQKQLYAEHPVTRYTGDFTVTMGNTTWVLRDVYFDQPDANRATRYREVSVPVPPRTA
ncbi:hypothetical protein AU196_20765 [Mycobacterium sp. IS-1742]|nr:hypothetical protein AU196_20765 [Mycobacterium sp. IS-1742]